VTGFILRRVAAAIPLLLATSFIVFAFLQLAPGSPETLLLGGRDVDPATREAIRAEYHLNDPFLVQYWLWLKGVITGDLGQSIEFHNSVSAVVVPRIGPTVELAVYALVLIVCIGLPLGVVTGARKSSAVDNTISSISLIGSSMATYVSGILLIAVFGVALGWFPVFGLGSPGLDRIYHLTLPAIALAVALIALVQRTTRVALADVLDQDFIQTARSRGFREWRVITKHGIRSSLIPVVTITGLAFGYLISGAVLVEYTFGLNGLGGLLVQSVQTKDYAVVQAITLIFTVAFIAVNLVVDILCVAIDPRARRGGRSQ
jgi:peptide/nickel transport system permease protein